MSPKSVLTVSAVLFLLHGIGFFLGAEEIAKLGAGDISELALKVGKGNNEIVAMFNLFGAFLMFAARGLDVPAARTVTKGAAIGYIVMFAGIIYHMQTLVPLQQPPLPAAVVFALIALWATYVGWIQKDNSPTTADSAS